MPVVAYLPGKITMNQYYNDHFPPHSHVRHQGQETKIRIAELTVLAGPLSGSDLDEVLTWARDHQAALALNWVLAKAGMNLLDIPYP